MANCFLFPIRAFALFYLNVAYTASSPANTHTHILPLYLCSARINTHIKFPSLSLWPSQSVILFIKMCVRALAEETIPLCVGVVCAVWPSHVMPPPQPVTAILPHGAPVRCPCFMPQKRSRKEANSLEIQRCTGMWWNETAPPRPTREKKKHKRQKQNQRLHFCKVVDVFSRRWPFLSCLLFSIVCFCGRYLVLRFLWNITVYDFNSLMCPIWWWQWTRWLSWRAVLWAAPRCCVLFGSECECESEEEEEAERINHKDRVLGGGRSPPKRMSPAAPTGGPARGLGGGLSSDDNTCPCYVYITLMLTCNLSAVAAWRQSLRVCTEVATCEFVQYMQVCVRLCPRRNLSVVTPKATRACTLRQLRRTHKHKGHTHTTTLTCSSSCSPCRHIVPSSACHSAWRLYSVSTFLF